jgi:uncharacterized spore protein YtfJ
VRHWEIETRIEVGEALKAENRVLYPVLKIEVIHSRGEILGSWVIPLAVLVVEPGEDYLIFLHKRENGAEELAEIAPSLKVIVEEARKILTCQ